MTPIKKNFFMIVCNYIVIVQWNKYGAKNMASSIKQEQKKEAHEAPVHAKDT